MKKERVYRLMIETPDRDIETAMKHIVENPDEANMRVHLSSDMPDGMHVWEAETTEEALIIFAQSLPIGYRIKACLSCRYGNFCPIGDYDNELFCVTDFSPKEASDLWHVTEDVAERENRRRTLFDVCNQYVPQSEDYYTYNDYYQRMYGKKRESE